MESLFFWIETSALSVWSRESTSIFAFPTFLIVHAVGMALVAGMNAAIDLRILGFAPHVPLTNPVFWIKLVFVAVGLVQLRMIDRRLLANADLDAGPVPTRARRLAWGSLACWVGAIFTGRFLAYTYITLMTA